MGPASKMLLWFAAVSALHGGAGWGTSGESLLNAFFKNSDKYLLKENDAYDRKIYGSSDMGGYNDEKSSQSRALRIDSVKNQILQKLRLTERPRPATSARISLPWPVKNGDTMLNLQKPHNYDHDPHLDDFYGKTDQKVIFPDDVSQDELGKCEGFGRRHPAACFSFIIPGDLQPQDVDSTELWVYKESDSQDIYNQTLLVSESTHWDHNRQFPKLKPIAIHSTNLHEGWIKHNVGWAAANWLEVGKVHLEISCPSCGGPPHKSPISLLLNHRPFLVYNTKHNTKKRRVRHMECSSGISECCRERLYISFEELGWNDWIIQPLGYDANFCKGSCNSIAAVTISGSYHSSVIKKLFHSANSPRRLELRPCCTPTTFSPLQILYMDSNNTVTQKTLPNMIVESCGCM